MTKLEKFVYNNFNLTESDKILVPAILAEIQQEIDDNHYDDNGLGQMSEYTLYDVFDEKLAKAIAKSAS